MAKQARSATSGLVRAVLLALQAGVGATALAGGLALVVGSLDPDLSTPLVPPVTYLEQTPFSSYLIPGVVLAGLVGGLHILALTGGLRRRRWSVPVAASAALLLLGWIFVQMVFIPFSFLQALYFAIGMVESALVMIALGSAAPAPE